MAARSIAFTVHALYYRSLYYYMYCACHDADFSDT